MQIVAIAVLLFMWVLPASHAQVSMADSSISFITVGPCFQAYMPGGDLASRFGYHSGLGIFAGYKHKSNWYANVGWQFLVGSDVREQDMLNHLGYLYSWTDGDGNTRTVGGWIDGNGDIIYPGMNMRGFAIPLRIGHIFHQLHLGKQNPNCGVFLEGGIQFIQHKIKIEVPAYAQMPYLSKDMLKGYDRLTNGLGGVASIGYQYYGNRRFLNFFISADFAYNVTKSRRSWDYDTGLQDTDTRQDITWGARLGWVLPLYNVAPEKYYYY
ncbi:MAG: hypothetical protein KF690_05540 [Bacteroidetes bacterium]|nr:hypothetical protein [Bacteroidota bacterium]